MAKKKTSIVQLAKVEERTSRNRKRWPEIIPESDAALFQELAEAFAAGELNNFLNAFRVFFDNCSPDCPRIRNVAWANYLKDAIEKHRRQS